MQPSRHYELNEESGKEEFMRTLCPAWADRILYNERMDKLFRHVGVLRSVSHRSMLYTRISGLVLCLRALLRSSRRRRLHRPTQTRRSPRFHLSQVKALSVRTLISRLSSNHNCAKRCHVDFTSFVHSPRELLNLSPHYVLRPSSDILDDLGQLPLWCLHFVYAFLHETVCRIIKPCRSSRDYKAELQ